MARRRTPSTITPVRVGRRKSGSFGNALPGVSGRVASSSRIGSTDQAVKGGSSAYGRSSPTTGIGGAGGSSTGNVVATITNPGGTPAPVPGSAPRPAPSPVITKGISPTPAPRTGTSAPRRSTASASITSTSPKTPTVVIAGAKKAVKGRGAAVAAGTGTKTRKRVTVVGAKRTVGGRSSAVAAQTIKRKGVSIAKKKAGSRITPVRPSGGKKRR